MSQSGYINWHRLTRLKNPWACDTSHQTYVYGFWLVDYQRNHYDHGVALLKQEDGHPDWFIHADRADHVLTAYCGADTLADSAVTQVFDTTLAARPLLGSILLGTSNAAYTLPGTDQAWNCTQGDLTRRGRRLIKALNHLYERTPWIITFVDPATD